MKIEAKLLASLRTPELKKIRAPNFFIFSTDSEKSLLDPEPVGRLLKTKKSSTTREKCATRNLRNFIPAELFCAPLGLLATGTSPLELPKLPKVA